MRPPLGLFTNDADAVFQSSVIAGANDVAARAGLSFEVRELPQPPSDPEAVLELTAGTPGSLVIANVLGDAALGAMSRSGHAVTLVSHRAPGLGVPSVLHDNRQGMRQLVEYLVASGRTKFAYVSGNREQLDGRERERSFRDELMRHGLDVASQSFLDGDFEPAVAARSLRAFLALGASFDAVVSADYLMAIAVIEVLREAGVEVPADVAVVGFGDGPEALDAGLTVVAADVVELGRRGARQLLAQLHGERLRGHTLIRTKLIVRDS